jgi:hypothetical protein
MSINTNMFYLYKKTVKRTGIHIIVELIDISYLTEKKQVL